MANPLDEIKKKLFEQQTPVWNQSPPRTPTPGQMPIVEPEKTGSISIARPGNPAPMPIAPAEPVAQAPVPLSAQLGEMMGVPVPESAPFTPDQAGIDQRAAIDAQAAQAMSDYQRGYPEQPSRVTATPSAFSGWGGVPSDGYAAAPAPRRPKVGDMIESIDPKAQGMGIFAKAPTAQEGFVNPFTEPYADGSVPRAFGLADPTSSTAPASEDPFSAPISVRQTPTADPNQEIRLADPTSSTLGKLTTVGGASLSEFLSGAAMPEQGFARAENAMYGDNSLSRGLGGDAATKAYQDASAAREGRIEQNFGNPRGPDSMDRGSGMSMEEATRLAGGDTALAKQMIESEKQGYDPVTGQPIQSGKEGMTFEQEMSARRQRLARS